MVKRPLERFALFFYSGHIFFDQIIAKKTSIVKFFRGMREKHNESTDGIEVSDVIVSGSNMKKESQDEEITLRMCDFGGQAVFCESRKHTLFLTPNFDVIFSK